MGDKTLSHKGYYGSIEMSIEDERLFGEVLFINDLINYEGATLAELKASFAEAVDEYLADCEKNGEFPEKPFSGTFNVRLSQDLHRSACVKAAVSGVSLNEFIRGAVELAVAEEKTVVHENHHHKHMHVHQVTFSAHASKFSEDDFSESQEWHLSETTRHLN